LKTAGIATSTPIVGQRQRQVDRGLNTSSTEGDNSSEESPIPLGRTRSATQRNAERINHFRRLPFQRQPPIMEAALENWNIDQQGSVDEKLDRLIGGFKLLKTDNMNLNFHNKNLSNQLTEARHQIDIRGSQANQMTTSIQKLSETPMGIELPGMIGNWGSMEKYSLTGAMDFQEWINRYERMCEAANWNVTRKIKLLPTLLADDALNIYEEVKQKVNKVNARNYLKEMDTYENKMMIFEQMKKDHNSRLYYFYYPPRLDQTNANQTEDGDGSHGQDRTGEGDDQGSGENADENEEESAQPKFPGSPPVKPIHPGPRAIDGWIDFEQMKDDLMDVLGDPNKPSKRMSEFQTTSQRPDEPVRSFAFRLKKLWEEIFPKGMEIPRDRMMLIERFRSGVHETMERELVGIETDNFEELIQKASNIEFRLKSSKLGQRGSIVNAVITERERWDRKPKPIAIHAVTREMDQEPDDQYRQPQSPVGKPQFTLPRRRERPAETGSGSMNMEALLKAIQNMAQTKPAPTEERPRGQWVRRNQPPQESGDAGQQNTGQQAWRCFICDQTGHIARNCTVRSQQPRRPFQQRQGPMRPIPSQFYGQNQGRDPSQGYGQTQGREQNQGYGQNQRHDQNQFYGQNQGREQNYSYGQTQGREPMRCFACGQFGHMVADCRKRQGSTRQSFQGRPPRFQGSRFSNFRSSRGGRNMRQGNQPQRRFPRNQSRDRDFSNGRERSMSRSRSREPGQFRRRPDDRSRERQSRDRPDERDSRSNSRVRFRDESPRVNYVQLTDEDRGLLTARKQPRDLSHLATKEELEDMRQKMAEFESQKIYDGIYMVQLMPELSSNEESSGMEEDGRDENMEEEMAEQTLMTKVDHAKIESSVPILPMYPPPIDKHQTGYLPNCEKDHTEWTAAATIPVACIPSVYHWKCGETLQTYETAMTWKPYCGFCQEYFCIQCSHEYRFCNRCNREGKTIHPSAEETAIMRQQETLEDIIKETKKRKHSRKNRQAPPPPRQREVNGKEVGFGGEPIWPELEEILKTDASILLKLRDVTGTSYHFLTEEEKLLRIRLRDWFRRHPEQCPQGIYFHAMPQEQMALTVKRGGVRQELRKDQWPLIDYLINNRLDFLEKLADETATLTAEEDRWRMYLHDWFFQYPQQAPPKLLFARSGDTQKEIEKRRKEDFM
jgi:hypothetical protein